MSIIIDKYYSTYDTINPPFLQIQVIKSYNYQIIMNYGTCFLNELQIYKTYEINNVKYFPNYIVAIFDIIFNN